MANGFNKGRYLLPSLNLIERRITAIKCFLDNCSGNFNQAYYIGGEILDLEQAISDTRRYMLTYDERRLLDDYSERLEAMYKVIQLKLETDDKKGIQAPTDDL